MKLGRAAALQLKAIQQMADNYDAIAGQLAELKHEIEELKKMMALAKPSTRRLPKN